MARIKFKNLPKDQKISRDDMREVFGGNVIPSKYQGPMSSVRDNSRLANIDLQNKLQQQQQTLQYMSNISKMLHDTSMSIIRKKGG